MTAGRGIEHAEVSPEGFKKAGGSLEIIQVWMNLPAKLKRTDPWYRGLESEALLHVDGPSWTWHVVSGEVDGREGPVSSLTNLFMSWLELKEGASFSTTIPAGRGLMLYVVRGDVTVQGEKVPRLTMVEWDTNDGPELLLETRGDEAMVLLCHGDVIDEPVVAYGPFVMNTEAEIHEAYAEYREGKFGTPDARGTQTND
jgi:redox-sensitive bicupin YhaK (pirin superfamily)